MDDRQYDKAVDSFSQAYSLVHSPKVLYNLGIAYMSVARYADALRALEQFLAEATDAPPSNQATARRHVAELRAKVVVLEIKSDRPGADVALDGRPLGTITFDHPITIDPGTHQLHAEVGSDTVDQAFTAPPGQLFRLTLTFSHVAERPPPAVPSAPVHPAAGPAALVEVAPPAEAVRPTYKRPWFWAAVGGGAAVAVATILALTLKHTEYPAPDATVPGP